jgi:hypothetical protein
LDYFNATFVSAWRDTYNYKYWAGKEFESILDVPPGHPFAGQLSMADMKLRLSQYETFNRFIVYSHNCNFYVCSTMQNTEGGRKLNQAMVNTGRAVAHTGKAVGEFFASAYLCKQYIFFTH